MIKNTFQRCLKSNHPFRDVELHREIIEYVDSLGGSPYLHKHLLFNPNRFDASRDFKFDIFPGEVNENWDENNFNLSKLFENEPILAFDLFLNFELKRCEQFLCFSPKPPQFDWIEEYNISWTSYRQMLETLEDFIAPQFKKNLNEKIIQPALSNLRQFQLSKIEIIENFINKYLLTKPYQNRLYGVKSYVIRIKDVKIYTSSLNIDWLKIINSLLLDESKVNEDEIIVINGFDLMLQLIENLVKFDKR